MAKTNSNYFASEANCARIKTYLQQLQNNICAMIEAQDESQKFIEDVWHHDQGGGGISRILSNGKVIEKGGVNFSHVTGKALPKAATDKRPELAASPFQALGVSVVMHPQNPFAPTSHCNVRFIVVETKHEVRWWFGGGFDLTPYYGFQEDCQHWHATAKNACDPFGADVYPKYKKWADDYFFLKHRNEPRGIGGIFFDDLNPNDINPNHINHWDFETCFSFMQSVGEHYLAAYEPILARRKDTPFDAAQRQFQLYRRGRYVEFNLLYDRGTLFGLQSGGRTESILMSLPPLVAWEYNWQPQPGTQEAELYDRFLVKQDWV